MAGDREFELKFAIEPGDVDHLTGHALLTPAQAARKITRLQSTYFDTPDHLLKRSRMSLRTRRSGERIVQTLKRVGASIVDRDEWEHDGGGARPDVDWLRRTPVGQLFDEAVAAALVPQFSADIARTTMSLRYGAAEIECAIDTGVISARGEFLDVDEVEFELKAGAEADLVAFARLLAGEVPLVLDLASKAQRGYALGAGTLFTPSKKLDPDLSGVQTLHDVFAAIAGACLGVICRNATLVGRPRAGAAAMEEAVHKTRIALRHLRAALALFRPALRRRTFEALSRDVKWMSDKLGAARDADVFAGKVASAAAVATRLRVLQQDAHRELRSALASPRWRLLLLDLLAFSLDGLRTSKRDTDAAAFVRAQLATHRAALANDTRGWSRHSEGALHAIRKSAKMLRYKLDLVRGLPGLGTDGGSWRHLDDDLQTLQDVLGEAHDATGLRARLTETIVEKDAPPGTPQEEWGHVQAAARDLADTLDVPNLEKARKAAKRLRRNEVS